MLSYCLRTSQPTICLLAISLSPLIGVIGAEALLMPWIFDVLIRPLSYLLVGVLVFKRIYYTWYKWELGVRWNALTPAKKYLVSGAVIVSLFANWMCFLTVYKPESPDEQIEMIFYSVLGPSLTLNVLYGIGKHSYLKVRSNNHFPGYRRRIIDELLYSYSFSDWWRLIDNGPASPYFISRIFFDIVDLVSKTDEERKTIFEPNDWVQKFTEGPKSGKSNQLNPEDFETARTEFDRNPRDFVRCLERYSDHLRIRDLAESILVYCTDPRRREYERRMRLKCWTTLIAKIREIINDANNPAATIAAYTFPDPDGIRNFLDEIKIKDGLEDTGDKLLRFFNECISNSMPQEDKVEQSWKLDRLRDLFDTWDLAGRITLYSLSMRLKICFETERPLSAIYHQFQLNVLAFTSTISSSSNPTTVKEALQLLRDTGAERHQQWQILYTAIKDLNAELAEKKKIITCLAYRYVLEKLPNQSSAAWTKLWKNGGSPGGATGKWKVIWELAVKQELLSMVNEYNATVRPAAAGGAGPPAPAPAEAGPRRPRLEPLLRSDFNYSVSQWVRNLPRGAPHPPLTIHDLRNWTNWPSYDRGKILYSSLSGSIHTFGKAYEVDDNNWLSSDSVILAWLKPTGPVDPETREVVWGDEWTYEKGLPA